MYNKVYQLTMYDCVRGGGGGGLCVHTRVNRDMSRISVPNKLSNACVHTRKCVCLPFVRTYARTSHNTRAFAATHSSRNVYT